MSALPWDGRPRQYTVNFDKTYSTICFVVPSPRINNDWMMCSVVTWGTTYVTFVIANWYSSTLTGNVVFDIYGY